MGRSFRQTLPALLAALMLAACGGGGSDSPATPVATHQNQTATDGLGRFNYWRNLLQLRVLGRNAKLDSAAQGHSDYQALNEQITHYEAEGKPGFKGVCLTASLVDKKTGQLADPACDPAKVSSPEKISRLQVAGYALPQSGYAVGEVISKTSSNNGPAAADELVAAIFHRFAILEPMYKEAGSGAAASAGGYTYFTTDFSTIGLDPASGLGAGKAVTFPADQQTDVPVSFLSDTEIPDPVPVDQQGKPVNEVGYPISVHADIIYQLSVQSFTIKPQGGAELPRKLLDNASDSNMRTLNVQSAAAIVPYSPLRSKTTYEVQFTGTLTNPADPNNPLSVVKSWSFTTR